jgi:hypothetical protein
VKRSAQIQDLVKHIVANGAKEYVEGLPDLLPIDLEKGADVNVLGKLVQHGVGIGLVAAAAMVVVKAVKKRM